MLIFAFLILLIVVSAFITFAFLKPSRIIRLIRSRSIFGQLKRILGRSLETGEIIHVSNGRESIVDLRGGTGLLGLSYYDHVKSLRSDETTLPTYSSGDPTTYLLAHNIATKGNHANINLFDQVQITGITPTGYISGESQLISEQQPDHLLYIGHFGTEISLLLNQTEISHPDLVCLTDNIPAQAVIYSSFIEEPMVGEQVYFSSLILERKPIPLAGKYTADLLRGLVIIILVVGSLLKLLGIF